MFYLIISLETLILFHLASDRLLLNKERNNDTVAKVYGTWQPERGSLFDMLYEHATYRMIESDSFGAFKYKLRYNEATPILAQARSAIKYWPEINGFHILANSVWHHCQDTGYDKAIQVCQNEFAWNLGFRKGINLQGPDAPDQLAWDKPIRTKLKYMEPTIESTKEYIGMWVTEDGYIRHELLPGNRYDEARGSRKSAYQGAYKVSGNHIDYKDDTGFTADGEFRDGILYHAGMVLYKEK
ncbi:Atu4866 domain-containing protein [Anditalea andensis]|nr:Atu4866 domain-containing protein [Anditalea andensis]